MCPKIIYWIIMGGHDPTHNVLHNIWTVPNNIKIVCLVGFHIYFPLMKTGYKENPNIEYLFRTFHGAAGLYVHTRLCKASKTYKTNKKAI